MPKVKSSIIDLIDDELSKLVKDDIIKIGKAKKVYRKILIQHTEDQFELGNKSSLNKGKVPVATVSTKVVKKGYKNALVRRVKLVNYGRVAKRQATIFANQVKKQGIKKASKLLKIRSTNIFNNELGYYRDKGKLFGGKIVNKVKPQTSVFKKWVHGMYGSPTDARGTHLSADGQFARLDDNFIVGGTPVSAPREFGDPAEDINCSCGVEIVMF